MTVRETSIEAYNHLIADGNLSKKRAIVYRTLYEHGPMSEGKAHQLIGGERVSVSPRFSELNRMGLIAEVGHDTNAYGNRVILWDVTALVHPLPMRHAAKRAGLLEEIETIINDPNEQWFLPDPRVTKIKELIQAAKGRR